MEELTEQQLQNAMYAGMGVSGQKVKDAVAVLNQQAQLDEVYLLMKAAGMSDAEIAKRRTYVI
jgi:hypothetical protein